MVSASRWSVVVSEEEYDESPHESQSVCCLAELECEVKGGARSGSEWNDRQARDWMFRSGVDGPETWATLWSVLELVVEEKDDAWIREGANSYARVACPPCRCGSSSCAGSTTAGEIAHDAVTCWRCKNFFDARCVRGFEAAVCETNVISVEQEEGGWRHVAVGLDQLHAKLTERGRGWMVDRQAAMIAGKMPQASVRRGVAQAPRDDVGLLLAWGSCPRCGAELGAASLPKATISPVARKVLHSAVDARERDVLRRACLIEAGYALRRANEALLWERREQAVEACTRAIVVVNVARSLDPALFRGPVADLFFRAHYARSRIERRAIGALDAHYRDFVRYEMVGMLDSALLSRSQVVGRTIVPRVLEGVPTQFEVRDEELGDAWWPKRDLQFARCYDSEARAATLFRAINRTDDGRGVLTPALAVIALALDSRWCLHSEKAAKVYWDYSLLVDRTHENDPDDPLRCGRLDYGNPDFVVAGRDDNDDDMNTSRRRPAAITGADASRVFRSLEVVDSMLAYNFLFRVGRLCGKLYVLLELRADAVLGDPALDLAALGLAAKAVANSRAFLTSLKTNRLVHDLPDSILPPEEEEESA